MRSKLIDSVDVIVGFVIGAGEEADSAFNQGELIAVCIHFGRIKNRMSEVVNEEIIGVVGLGAVDDDRLEIFVPTLRLAEELAQSVFAINGVLSKAFDEFFRNVLVNIVGIGMAEIIVQSRPNVVAGEFFEIVHR